MSIERSAVPEAGRGSVAFVFSCPEDVRALLAGLQGGD